MTTVFYSTKRSSNVNIPNNKVCGYKIKNYNTKKGWQSGLKAGRDNGVVNQKFSRFATDCDAKEKGSCSGNTNWLNHRTGADLGEIKKGFTFSLERKGFRAGTIDTRNLQAESIDNINRRSGLGNRDITRKNFIAPPIQARNANRFSKLQADDISKFNNEVELGTKTLKKLFDVDIPDPLDTKWLEDKDRLIKIFKVRNLSDAQIEIELRTNKPLGREQRTTKVKTNIGKSNLTTGQKLAEISEEIKSGKTNSVSERAFITAQLVEALDKINDLSTLSNTQLTTLQQTVTSLGAPTKHKLLGFPRFINKAFWNANSGLLIFHILSRVRDDNRLSINKPVLNELVKGTATAITIKSMAGFIVKNEGRNNFLDLDDDAPISVVAKDYLVQEISNGNAVVTDFSSFDPRKF